jgi:hypothetical protein
MSSEKQEPKKGELTLAISEIQSTPVVETCTSVTYSFDPYNANAPDKNPIKKAADIEHF